MSTAGAAFHLTTPHPTKDRARARLDAAIAKAGQPLSCELDPEAWFPGQGAAIQARQAIAWCRQCPALQECRAWAHTPPVEPLASVVLGGEWWSFGKLANPWPKRNRREAAA